MFESRDLRSLCTRLIQSRPAQKNNRYKIGSLIRVQQRIAVVSLAAFMMRPFVREEYCLKITTTTETNPGWTACIHVRRYWIILDGILIILLPWLPCQLIVVPSESHG